MSKIFKKRNQADSAENYQEETVAKKRKLKNSGTKKRSKKFLNECQKKTKSHCKVYSRKGKLCYLKKICFDINKCRGIKNYNNYFFCYYQIKTKSMQYLLIMII